MFKLSIRNLIDKKIRYALTAFAVLLGVSFVVASFVLSDSLRKVFNGIGGDIAAPVSVLVRTADPLGREADFNTIRPPVPLAVLESIRKVPGVTKASGDLQTISVGLTSSTGESVKPAQQGPPLIGSNWDGPEASVSAFELIEGVPPAAGQLGLDVDTAERFKLSVGDPLTVAGNGTYTMSAIVRFGKNNGGGAAYVVFDTSTAQKIFGTPGEFDSISVAGEKGISQSQLRNRISESLPEDYEAITGQQVGQEFSNAFSQIIGIIRNALLGFAGVALFVSAFIISNTFSIVIGQRIRELAILRAVGASSRQVFASLVIEALFLGLIGSLVGAVAGLGVAWLIAKIITSQGGGLGSINLILTPRTWAIALAVGLLVTLVSALLPAWRAGRIPPVAAMREGATLAPSNPKRRVIIGGISLVLGVILLASALSGSSPSTKALLSSLILGALLVFLGVAGLSPLIARSAANLLGRRPLAVITMVLGGIVILGAVVALIASIASLKIGIIIAGIPAAALLGMLGLALAKTGRAALGLTGQLARGNAARNPRRTASTAAALMIGLALVGLVSVVAESFKQSFVAQLEGSIQADYFFSDETGFAGFTPTFGQEVAALPEVGDVAMIRFSQRAIVVEGKKKDVAAVPPATVGSILKFTFNKGGYDGLDDNGILIGQDAANDLAKTVGDTVPVTFAQTGTKDLRIVGVFDKSFGQLGNWIISTKTFEANFLPKEQVDLFGGATRRPGVDAAAAKTAIKQVADSYPQVRFEDRTAFKKTQEKQIDQLLVVINALLFLSLIIALLGIANTMALSVFERTRELGLLRAVGMRRDQMRGMVRFESIIVATFGAVLGLILGVIFGIAVVAALPKNVVSTTAVPIPTLIQLLVGSIIAGLVAALFPARRAARLNVLDAIAYE